jgi:hypothetical protein
MLSSIHNKLLFVLLLGIFCSVFAREVVDISRSGRRIQRDGFLIEWSEKSRREWSGSTVWYWDAVNTPEGVAGYFHSEATRCSSWTFQADVRHGASLPLELSVPDTGETTGRFFCTARTQRDSLFVLTAEWVIPWDSVAVDSGGTYAIHLAGHSACGDTLQPLLCTGRYSLRNRGRMGVGFGGWCILAVVLAGTVAVARQAFRKKTRGRESLHR